MENILAAGILTACATMFARTLLLASVINTILFRALFAALLVMTIATYFVAFLLWLNARGFRTAEEITLENPFQLGIALRFGAFLIAILLLSQILKIYFGAAGTYFLAATAGLADVDPITLSMSQMSKQGLDVNVAARAILIAVSVNSGIKGVFSWLIGGRGLALRVASTLAGAVIAGLLIT
jgi:uncharacterized membrane protein (DUF4010 family)